MRRIKKFLSRLRTAWRAFNYDGPVVYVPKGAIVSVEIRGTCTWTKPDGCDNLLVTIHGGGGGGGSGRPRPTPEKFVATGEWVKPSESYQIDVCGGGGSR